MGKRKNKANNDETKQTAVAAQARQKIVDQVHQTHLIEAIKYLGRAIHKAQTKQKKHAWQVYRFTPDECHFLEEKMKLLEDVNAQYERWHDQLSWALEQGRVDQYDDLYKILSDMRIYVEVLDTARLDKKRRQPQFNQLLACVWQEISRFFEELQVQLSSLKKMDEESKQRERRIVRNTLYRGYDDLKSASQRLGELHQQMTGLYQAVCADKKSWHCRWFNQPEMKWLPPLIALVYDASFALTYVCYETEPLPVNPTFPGNYYQLSKIIDAYSKAAKKMMEVYLLILPYQKNHTLSANHQDQLDDIVLRCRMLFDTVKALRANHLKLMLYKVDKHRCQLDVRSDPNSQDRKAQIDHLLADEDFDILHYSRAPLQRPRSVEAAHREADEHLQLSSDHSVRPMSPAA